MILPWKSLWASYWSLNCNDLLYLTYFLSLSRPTRTNKPTEVDDEFFDLKEFNEWTEKQEEQDMLSESERELDEDIDFDEDLEEDLEEDDEEQNANGECKIDIWSRHICNC